MHRTTHVCLEATILFPQIEDISKLQEVLLDSTELGELTGYVSENCCPHVMRKEKSRLTV